MDKKDTYYGVIAVLIAIGVIVPVMNMLDAWRLEHACPTLCSEREVQAIELRERIESIAAKQAEISRAASITAGSAAPK